MRNPGWRQRVPALLVGLGVLGVVGSSCVGEPPPGNPPNPAPDRAVFEQTIYPVLLRDCAFPDCHGDPDPADVMGDPYPEGRFFRVHGPGRSRLAAETGISAPLVPEEVEAAYQRSISMLASTNDCDTSLFVGKPLEVDQGGMPHRGADKNGRNLYPNKQNYTFRVLRAWACGEPIPPPPAPGVTP